MSHTSLADGTRIHCLRRSEALMPGTKLDIEFPFEDNLQVPPGQPFCIWKYTKRGNPG